MHRLCWYERLVDVENKLSDYVLLNSSEKWRLVATEFKSIHFITLKWFCLRKRNKMPCAERGRISRFGNSQHSSIFIIWRTVDISRDKWKYTQKLCMNRIWYKYMCIEALASFSLSLTLISHFICGEKVSCRLLEIRPLTFRPIAEVQRPLKILYSKFACSWLNNHRIFYAQYLVAFIGYIFVVSSVCGRCEL